MEASLVSKFGLANVPAAFQQALNVVFGKLARKNVLTFIDDLMIVSETQQEHKDLVSEMVETWSKYQSVNDSRVKWNFMDTL